MNILILGGTIFLGKHLVYTALRRNHSVTLFNRGIHNPELFPECEKLTGERAGDLSPLKGRKFDAVIDTSGHIPADVLRSAELLKDNAGHYTFISSISAYSNFAEYGITEESETNVLADGNADKMTMENYGALKVMCENNVMKVFRDKALIIRPGLIVGDSDWSDRFTYWIHRMDAGGEVLVPDTKNFHVQFIDVKDLAEWIIQMSEEKKSGIYNATGPKEPLAFGSLIEACADATNNKANLIWVSEEFIAEEKIEPWTELPLWVTREEQGVNHVSIAKALNDGLKFRPLEETLIDTLKFDKSRINYKFRSGLTPEKEKELLKKWNERSPVEKN